MMSTPNPNDNLPENDDQAEDVDQSDALKRAILKLQQSGMLTHVPDDLEDLGATDAAPSVPPPESSKLPSSTKSEQTNPNPDDQTIASRPPAASPTLASADDVEKHADERAKWAAVMSGWDDEGASVPETSSAPPTIPSRPATEPVESEASSDDAWELPQDQEEENASPATIPSRSTVESSDAWELPTEDTEPQPESSVEDQSAITIRRKEMVPQQKNDTALTEGRDQTPWTLQQFFDGEIDLEQELLKRMPTVPAMTTIKFRTLGMNSSRKVATLAAQDGSSQIIFDADVATKVVQISFTFGSMMTLRFVLSDIPGNNRERWLELMRREQGGLAFLWNEERWREDYLVCISREYSTNIFAFSPRNFESAVRLTNDVTEKLLDWLEDIWNSEPEPEEDDDSPLLTW